MPFEDLFYSYKTSMHIVVVGFPSELTFRVSKGKVNSATRPWTRGNAQRSVFAMFNFCMGEGKGALA
jgi:hypothetical protein